MYGIDTAGPPTAPYVDEVKLAAQPTHENDISIWFKYLSRKGKEKKDFQRMLSIFCPYYDTGSCKIHQIVSLFWISQKHLGRKLMLIATKAYNIEIKR